MHLLWNVKKFEVKVGPKTAYSVFAQGLIAWSVERDFSSI